MVGSLRFSLREHKVYAAYNPDIRFNKNGGASKIRIDSYLAGAGSMGHGYCFIVVPREWLNGKYLRWNWNGGRFDTTDPRIHARMLIYDGEYDRSSDTDFPSGSAIPTKGNGLLQSYNGPNTYGTWGPTTVDLLIDVSGGTEEKCTVFFQMIDAWAGNRIYLDIDWVEFNSGSGGSGTLYDEQFTDDVHMEVTGTYGDYGYISTGEIVVVKKAKPSSIIPLMRVLDLI